VQTDQPVYAGGEGSAPPPFQLFLASIGTCAGIFVLNFCRQRDISTEGIRMQQIVETDPETRKVSRIVLDIQLPADFPERYVGAVKRAAELCSVKKLIENPPEFAIEARIEAE
jgi:ribosomal protein S12 methylthiotransferase accessory factor